MPAQSWVHGEPSRGRIVVIWVIIADTAEVDHGCTRISPLQSTSQMAPDGSTVLSLLGSSSQTPQSSYTLDRHRYLHNQEAGFKPSSATDAGAAFVDKCGAARTTIAITGRAPVSPPARFRSRRGDSVVLIGEVVAITICLTWRKTIGTSNTLSTVVFVGTVDVTGSKVAVAVRKTTGLAGGSPNTLTTGVYSSGPTNITVAVGLTAGGIGELHAMTKAEHRRRLAIGFRAFHMRALKTLRFTSS